MRKILVFMLFFFFISGTFTGMYRPVSAATLVEDSWSSKTPMSHSRHNVGLVEVAGKIYAIGGSPEFDEVGTNECYDPASDTWATLAPMPTPRSRFAIFVHESKIYCIGGGYWGKVDWWWGPARLSTDVVEVYDTVTDSWNTRTSAPFGGDITSQVHVIDGKIFVIIDLGGLPTYMYDPVTDVWINKASVPDIDSYDYSVVVDGNIILFSNVYVENHPGYMKVRSYDPTVDVWTEKANIPHALSAISSGVVVDNKIAFFSFNLFTSENDSPFQLGVLRYDSKTDTWSKGKPGPAIIRLDATVATTGIYAPQRVYVLWKQYDTTHLSNWVYNPTSNTWSTAQNMPSDPGDFGVVVIDDLLYVISSNTNELYVPIGYHGTSPLNNTYVLALILIIGATVTGMIVFSFLKRKSS